MTNKCVAVVVVTGSGGEEGETDVRMLLFYWLCVYMSPEGVDRKRYVHDVER